MLAARICFAFIDVEMWLLETSTLRLRYFPYPEAAEEGYAILSHVWDAQEQSFQELQEIHRRCDATGEDPLESISTKVKNFCNVCVEHGYRWAWIDTCCIDKTSSAELSEAINSMFRYYTLSLVCYAYLRDVSKDQAFQLSTRPTGRNNTPQRKSNFAWSRWHTRGWTLQELIAPQVLLFLSDSWDFLGSKADLSADLESITQIPVAVLRFEQSLEEMSVAQRMSWAARRQTTRVEDEAYCLLGIFNINMPTLYGEGRKAFQRLQEEIMRQSPDTTLFAWGESCPWILLTSYSASADAPLFASRPREFLHSSGIRQAPRVVQANDQAVEVLEAVAQTSAPRLPIVNRIQEAFYTYIMLPWLGNGSTQKTTGEEELNQVSISFSVEVRSSNDMDCYLRRSLAGLGIHQLQCDTTRRACSHPAYHVQ